MLPRRDPLHAFFLATEHEEPPLALKLTDRLFGLRITPESVFGVREVLYAF